MRQVSTATSSSALRAPRPGGPSAEPAAHVPAHAEAPIEALESVVDTLESVARGSLIVAAAELASTSDVALAVLAAVLRPAVAESLRVEVALSTPLLTSAMLVFFRLSTEELMPAANSVDEPVIAFVTVNVPLSAVLPVAASVPPKFAARLRSQRGSKDGPARRAARVAAV